jgi:hypothetical protein
MSARLRDGSALAGNERHEVVPRRHEGLRPFVLQPCREGVDVDPRGGETRQHIFGVEWLAERARFIGSLIGLTDEQFNSETAAGEWTYRAVAKHGLTLEQDSLKTIAADRAARESIK